MCVVIDLNVVCLICLQPGKDLHPIFTPDEDDPEMQIAQKITILSELKINQNNRTLPKKICSKCLQDLKAAWRFRKNCKAAVTIFQTIVKLDNEQPQKAEEKTNAQDGLQILLTGINTDNKGEESKNTSESLIPKKTTPVHQFIINDKVDTTSCDELEPNSYEENPDNEIEEFQSLEEAGENEQDEDYESNLVEYYLAEEGVSEEIINVKEKPARTPMRYEEIINKPVSRGRPRKSLLKKGVTKNKNIVQSKSSGVIVIDSANSSEETSRPEVRQVKTRKRNSISPERKTAKICEICGNSYRFQHALKAHMRRHYNDKPFPCECCEKAFVSNVELRRHMRVHTGQKPYACQYCERRFSDFGSRIKHERTHTGERPYLCITCGKSFAYPHVLSVHLRTHTGEKRFRCDYCTKGFTKKAYLISHMNQHHCSFEIIIDNNTTEKSENHSSKAIHLEECTYTTEFENEETINEGEEYVEDNNDETHSMVAPKIESDDEAEIQEIDVEPEDFALTVK